MIEVNFAPEQATTTISLGYPIWTVLGLVVVVAVIAGLVLWWKTRSANPNERIYDDVKIEHRDANEKRI